MVMPEYVHKIIWLIQEDCRYLTTFPHPDLTTCWHKEAAAFIEENWDVI